MLDYAMVHILGTNVPLVENYFRAWSSEMQRNPAAAMHLMLHVIRRATSDPFDDANQRQAVAMAGWSMIEELRRSPGGDQHPNLGETAACLEQIAEGQDMEIQLIGPSGRAIDVSMTGGARTSHYNEPQRLAGSRWTLHLGPNVHKRAKTNDYYGILGAHELVRFMERGHSPFERGSCGWREVCEEWRRSFDRLMYHTLIDPSCPPLLRRSFAASTMVLIMSAPKKPRDAEDTSTLLPTQQVLDWWQDAVGCLADGSTLTARLVHDDGTLLEMAFDNGEQVGKSELPIVPDAINSTYDRVVECKEGLPGSPKPSAKAEKIGRNAPCPCGSGKKYKRCCGSDA